MHEGCRRIRSCTLRVREVSHNDVDWPDGRSRASNLSGGRTFAAAHRSHSRRDALVVLHPAHRLRARHAACDRSRSRRRRDDDRQRPAVAAARERRSGRSGGSATASRSSSSAARSSSFASPFRPARPRDGVQPSRVMLIVLGAAQSQRRRQFANARARRVRSSSVSCTASPVRRSSPARRRRGAGTVAWTALSRAVRHRHGRRHGPDHDGDRDAVGADGAPLRPHAALPAARERLASVAFGLVLVRNGIVGRSLFRCAALESALRRKRDGAGDRCRPEGRVAVRPTAARAGIGATPATFRGERRATRITCSCPS